MNLYISDLHFGHANAIKHDSRPFDEVEQMDKIMIELWNSQVQEEDHVYIIGDFCYKNEKAADWYLRQLKGHKHLIIGNHDQKTLKNEEAMSHFETVEQMSVIKDEDKRVCLCHYPIADWYGARHGSWLVYGHIHASREDAYQFMKTRERALNAAACINNYMPVRMEELIRNNQYFQEYDTVERN